MPETATQPDSATLSDIGPGTAATAEAPFYLPAADEVELFHAAYDQRIPVLLKGPTGCGKTRFVEHMAWHIARERGDRSTPSLVTVTCHDDMTASDLVGRYLLSTDGTTWLDGPLTQAVRTRRDLLSRRGCRGAQGHDGRPPRADRPPPHAAGGAARHDDPGAPRLPARGVVQPGLPGHGQGPQAQHAPTFHGDRVRLSDGRSGDRHHRPRVRHRRRKPRVRWRFSAIGCAISTTPTSSTARARDCSSTSAR